MENEAEGPKFDLWLPPVPLWLLSGHPERSSPPQAAKYPDPAPQAPTPRRRIGENPLHFPGKWGILPVGRVGPRVLVPAF